MTAVHYFQLSTQGINCDNCVLKGTGKRKLISQIEWIILDKNPNRLKNKLTKRTKQINIKIEYKQTLTMNQ